MPSLKAEKSSHQPRRAPGHKRQNIRWTVEFPDGVDHICILYIGVQFHGSGQDIRAEAEQRVTDILNEPAHQPAIIETLRVTAGNDLPGSRLWICHWTQSKEFLAKLKQIDILSIWKELGRFKDSIGLWYEHFVVPLERLQANYSKEHYRPGLAALANVTHPSHRLTGYWGAGRDRLAASSYDLFESPTHPTVPQIAPAGYGQYLVGSSYENMCHIRSGQRWEECEKEEREAYENNLQKKLMQGMEYLWDSPEETGSIGLRMGQKLAADSKTPVKETSVMGFHHNWASMEEWSSRHPTHLAIFSGAMKHSKRFGDRQKFMTWQEVAILKKGEARFEYLNCNPKTGVMRWVELQDQSIVSLPGSKL